MTRPVGRPVVTSTPAHAVALGAENPARTAATHSPGGTVLSASPRLSAAALARLAGAVDARDRAILGTLAAFRLARGDQLRRLHLSDVDPRSARRVLARLQHLQLITRLERRIGGKRRGSDGSLYRLTSAGLRLTRPSAPARSPWPISRRFQDHILAVTELFTGLTEAHRAGKITLRTFVPEAERRFTGRYGQPTTFKADAFVRLDGPDYIDLNFLEVDLDSESPATIRRKAEVYYALYLTGREQAAHGGVFPKVSFLVPTEDRRADVAAALAAIPKAAQRLFAVNLLTEAVPVLTGGGPEPADDRRSGAAA